MRSARYSLRSVVLRVWTALAPKSAKGCPSAVHRGGDTDKPSWTISRPGIPKSGETGALCNISRLPQTLTLLLGICLILVLTPARLPAQGEAPGTADPSQGGAASPGQSSTAIGDSGFSVTIPEVRMNRIIGDRPAPPPPAKEDQPPPAPEPPVEKPVEEEAVGPPPKRLPFDPSERKHRVGPIRGPAPVYTPEPPPEKEEVGKEEESPFLRPPKAPEDIVGDLPPPKKEVMEKKAYPAVPLLEDRAVKESLRSLPVERLDHGGPADPREWIQLESRKEPEVVPPPPEPEPEPVREIPSPVQPVPSIPSTPAKEAPEPPTEPAAPQPAPEPAPTRLPEPEPVIEPAPKESLPPEQLPEATEPRTEPKESLPTVEEPTPQVREILPSPLDDDAVHSREVMEYLRDAAPILEELSILMTRAPSLAVADYDPSDPNAAAVPKEIPFKMDSLKRELQILDSKTFAIIPPAKYAGFHSLIRQSIAETHKACDAIMGFLNDTNPGNLQKVHDHLLKAKELIHRTREKSS